LELQEVFQVQVVSRRKGEFERLKRLREERLAEERALRSQEREIRRKKEYFRRLEEQRLLKIQEEEEARKREGVSLIFVFVNTWHCSWGLSTVVRPILCNVVFLDSVRVYIQSKNVCL